MAKKATKAVKKAAPKKAAAAAKPAAAPKAIKEALTKSGLVSHIAESTGVAAKDVRAVLASLEGAVHGSISNLIYFSCCAAWIKPNSSPRPLTRISPPARTKPMPRC